MKYLHLDQSFTPFQKSIAYEEFTFNGGEPHIKIKEAIDINEPLLITCRPRSFNDLGLLFMAVNALKLIGVKELQLLMPYFPGARQDRVMVKGEAFSLKVYASLINQLNLNRVIILDPHSDVCPALLDQVLVIDQIPFVRKLQMEIKEKHLISPDAGALKKTFKLAKALKADSIIECSKVRDIETGRLSAFTVHADNLRGKTCVIVDDICDGGGTFLGLAKALKEKNAGKLILIVTHGIFSKGSERLAAAFDEIYTTDSFQTLNDTNITQINIETFINL